MDEIQLIDLLNNFKNNKIDLEDALQKLKDLPYSDIGFAKIDNHRKIRHGFSEVIYCEGKSIDHIYKIAKNMAETENNILATRANKEVYKKLKEKFSDIEYNELARTIIINPKKTTKTKNKILVVSAGTADIPVAEEAVVTAEVLGNRVEKIYDIGVAGLHRILGNLEKFDDASVLITVAGMEGARPSVIGGIVDKPVIAVPTSVGYGTSFNGITALLAMLNSCASGIGVVNIDNGFGAAYLASKINRAIERTANE